MGKTELGHRSHAPRGEIGAGGNIQSELPPDRHHHHDREDRNQEDAGGIARTQVQAVEGAPDDSRCRHTVTALNQTRPQSSRNTTAWSNPAAMLPPGLITAAVRRQTKQQKTNTKARALARN